jgi:hypothetical protein
MPKAKGKRRTIKEQTGLSLTVVLSGQEYLAIYLDMSRPKGHLPKSVFADIGCVNTPFDP